jgi:hypothetical protein
MLTEITGRDIINMWLSVYSGGPVDLTAGFALAEPAVPCCLSVNG